MRCGSARLLIEQKEYFEYLNQDAEKHVSLENLKIFSIQDQGSFVLNIP